MVLTGSVDLFKKGVYERMHVSLPPIQSAIAAIFALAITASVVFAGCFRLNEHHQYVLVDAVEAFQFMENANAFLRAFA